MLRITVVKAERLAAMDWGGTSDPYVRFRLGEREVQRTTGRTAVQDSTLSPLWGERFWLDVAPSLDKPITLEVWDRDILRDEFMGQVAR